MSDEKLKSAQQETAEDRRARKRKAAVELLTHDETTSFIVVAFNKAGRVAHEECMATSEMLVAEKIVAAIGEHSLFGGGAPTADQGGLG
jgi:hypothetical protein